MPNIKVFIAHKREDEKPASDVARTLAALNTDFYLDIVDTDVAAHGEDLGDYIGQVLNGCTHLMAVVSEKTMLSWWVPFEIGIATEKRYPISTFAASNCQLPIYLKKWPYLTSLAHVTTYVTVAQATQPEILREGLM